MRELKQRSMNSADVTHMKMSMCAGFRDHLSSQRLLSANTEDMMLMAADMLTVLFTVILCFLLR